MGKYEEALERARQGLPIDEVFPELKESDDERIRREILETLSYGIAFEDSVLMPGATTTLKEAIAYLEKQKEQKPAEGAVLQKAFANSKIDYTLEEKCNASDYADVILPTSVAYGENEEEYKLHKIIEAAFIAGQKKEQKPAEWSEEDKLHQHNIITYLEFRKDKNLPEDTKYPVLDAWIDWLKSIRPQPEQEWTKEDNERYLSCLKRLGTSNPDQPETVNSKWFREHVCPQPHWKPSKEQMQYLAATVEESNENPILESLYNDLQKLF
jgi:hypothetical protein